MHKKQWWHIYANKTFRKQRDWRTKN
jgi:hypothetical protein